MLREMVRGGHARQSSQLDIDTARERVKNGDKEAWNSINWGFLKPKTEIYKLTRLPTIAEYRGGALF